MVLLAAACQGPPLESMRMANRGVGLAAEARAERFAPVPYATALDLLAAGDQEMARQDARFPLFRRYAPADSLYRAAYRAAVGASAEASARQAGTRAQLGAVSDKVERELASWRRTLDGSLVVLEAESAYSCASLALHKGTALLAAGEFEPAAEAFTRAERSIGEIVRIMDERAHDRSANIETWRAWVRDTIRVSRSTGTSAIIIDKHAHRLYLIRGGDLVRSFACDLGYNSAGQKLQEGDGATPEGTYRITHVMDRASRFYKALRLGYPNEADRRRFAQNVREGVISPHASIGGLIEIHGHGGMNKDWTEGCAAVTDEEMDELIRHVSVGTRVTIVRVSDQWP